MSDGGSAAERGFSLIEVIVATVISVIAILGLAHSFGIGRALINRFAEERNALGVVQARVEQLSTLPPDAPELTIGSHTGAEVELFPGVLVTETWTVVAVDDPGDGVAPADTDPDDYRRATVSLSWEQGDFPDNIQLSRQFLKP